MKIKPKMLLRVGMSLCFVGAFLSLTLIGIVIGVPMILAGFLLMGISFIRHGFKTSFGVAQ